MAGVFSSQVVTVAGRALIASATATNQIVFVKALSAGSVPADPSQTSGYDGVQGTITSSSSTHNVARVVTSYNNTNTSTSQPVKAIALMGRLASQSDVEVVIFAYCADSVSEIYFPSSIAPEQITRFAYNIAFEGDAPLEVTEAGAASLSDLDRFVSLHRAGDPTTGEDQTIKGSKTFDGEVTLNGEVHVSANIVPTNDSSVFMGSSNARFKSMYAGTVNGVYVELSQAATSYKATLACENGAVMTSADIIPSSQASDLPSCGRATRPWKEMYVKQAIHLTKGTSSTTDNLVIYEDDGGINLDNSYTGGDAGAFWFRKRAGGSLVGATVSAGEFIGANPTISKASVSTIPASEVVSDVYDGDVVTIPVGGLILVSPNVTWMQNNGAGRQIKPGESITITDTNKDAFFVSNWEVDTSWSSYARKSVGNSKYAYLKVGTYRALSYITYPANSQAPVFGAPILLQRVA